MSDSARDTETVEFVVYEEIVVPDKYQAEVPAGLSEEEQLRYLQDNPEKWGFVEQVSGPNNAPETHYGTLRIAK